MIQSISRAVAVLERLDAAGGDGMALRDLAAQIELKPPTVHGMLRTLSRLGYVAQDGVRGRYTLGPRAQVLGRRGSLPALLARLAAEPVQALHQQVNETVVLAMYHGGQRLSLLTVESSQALRVDAEFARDTNLYQTATGRVLLSRLGPADRQDFLAANGLAGSRWPGIADRGQFELALQAIRDAGFVSYTTADGYIRALAVPVAVDQPGLAPSLALGLYFPAVRGNPAREPMLIGALRATSVRIEQAVGQWYATADGGGTTQRPAPTPVPAAQMLTPPGQPMTGERV